MRKSCILLIIGSLAALVLLLALALTFLPCAGEISSLEIPRTPSPVTPDLIQMAPPEEAQAVLQATGFSLKNGIREAGLATGERVACLSLMAVSTGEFDALSIQQHAVDVVYAYLATKSGVARLPVAVGFRDGETYYALNGSAPEFLPVDRDTALEAARQRLPKGQTFGLTALRVSYKEGVDRSDCSRDWSPAWCELAREYNRSFGDTERQFLSKILTNQSWMPVGWVYAPYPAEDTTFSRVVSLP